VSGDVPVALLETLVLPDEVKIISSHNNRPLHLHFLHDARQDSAADLDESGERALLVDVNAVFGLIWGLESQTYVLHITYLLRVLSSQKLLLSIEEDVLLLLKRALCLIRHDYKFLLLQITNLPTSL